MNGLDAPENEIPAETLEDFIALGRQLAAQMAADSFQAITAVSGWTVDHVDTATEVALARMEVSARDALAAKGADPSSENWQAIWMAMEISYRETMEGLVTASRLRWRETLQ